MLVKALLILSAILAIYLLGRLHARRRLLSSTPQHTPKPVAKKSRLLMLAVFMFIPLLLGGMVYRHWQQERQVMRVRVINTQNGTVLQYQARNNAIQHRSFQELDGRRIILADQERMEFEPLP